MILKGKKRGFTLVEMLVVISVIGTLSTVGLVSLNSSQKRARENSVKVDVAKMATELDIALAAGRIKLSDLAGAPAAATTTSVDTSLTGTDTPVAATGTLPQGIPSSDELGWEAIWNKIYGKTTRKIPAPPKNSGYSYLLNKIDTDSIICAVPLDPTKNKFYVARDGDVYDSTVCE